MPATLEFHILDLSCDLLHLAQRFFLHEVLTTDSKDRYFEFVCRPLNGLFGIFEMSPVDFENAAQAAGRRCAPNPLGYRLIRNRTWIERFVFYPSRPKYFLTALNEHLRNIAEIKEVHVPGPMRRIDIFFIPERPFFDTKSRQKHLTERQHFHSIAVACGNSVTEWGTRIF